MSKCPFNGDAKCEECALFIANSQPSIVKPNGRCSIVGIALELQKITSKTHTKSKYLFEHGNLKYGSHVSLLLNI